MIKKRLILIRLFFSKQNQNTPKTIATNLFGNNAKWLCFAMFLFANFSFGQSQTFISSGTFNVPAGVTSVTVQAWGGGGAGGGANNANATRNGGGGGGGAYTIRTVSVTPLSTIAVTVGAGGTGVTASDTGTNTGNGGDGGTSTFASTVAVVAAGGKGGEVGNSTHSDNGNGGAGGLGGTFNGGNGQNGSNAGSGGGGGSAGTAINGNNGTLAGAAAVTGGGAGAGGRNSNGPGISATTLGGGGGGGRMNNNSPDVKGGDGFRGQVLVTWTPCSTFSLTGTNTATAACTSTGTSTVTLVSSAAGLPVGSYTVTYNTDSPSQTGLTASMNVTNAGTGSFTATGLTNAGSRTITVTRLATSTCSFSITSNNTANVIVNPQPTIANAGPDQSTGSGSFILAANTPTIGTGVWSIASGPSTLLSQFSNTSSPTATFTPAVAGTYVLNWAISNSCGTFNDQVVVANNCVTNMISNSDFSGGATGWTFATTYGDRVEVNPENTYFSNGNSSITAELDSQASLRQVTTVIPGVSYTVSFRYARRSNAATPATTGVTVKITGGSTDLISTGFTTTSTISQIGTYTFTPTSSSIGLEFYNTLHGGITFGTIIDDIVLIPTSQVNPAATTSPKGVFNTLTSCAGVAVQLDVENVPASGVTYAWTGPAGAVFSSTTIKNPTVILTGSGVQQVSVTTTTAAGCSGSSITYINVTAAPTITAPVASSVCSGSTYSSGAISSTGTTFSWSRAGVANINGGAAGAGGTGIANATGFTEVLTNSTANPINVTYVLTPGPPSSGCSGTPYNLVVTVNPTVGIAITAPVAGSVCSGSNYSSGAITSTGTTFDWSRAGVANINGGVAGAGGISIAKATGFSETLTNSTSSAINVTYVLTPKSASGCSGTPYNLVVTVNPTVGIAITAPLAGSVCSGSTYSSGAITSTGTTFDWSRAGVANINGGVAGAGGISIAKATGFSETLTNSTSSAINVTYVLTPKSASGCSGTPYNLVVTVNPTVGIAITAPVAGSVCSGSAYSSGAITSTGTTFDWSRAGVANINGGAAGAGGTSIAKATGFSETLTNSTSSAINVTYVLTPKSASGCSGTPYNLVVAVNPTPAPPTIGTITHLNCTTSTGSVVLENLPGGSWTIASTPSTVLTSGSGTTTTISGLSVGIYTFTVTNSNGCPSGFSSTVTIFDNFNTWNGSSWSRGVPPNASMNVIIDAVTPDSPFAADLTACALTINTGVVATVPSGRTLTITNEVTVNGSLTFENNASLVQINNASVNSGSIIYKRSSQPMKRYDFTYWSSPVAGQTLYSLSPNTRWDKYLSYTGDVWKEELSSGVMQPGIGYIIRVPEPNVTYLNGESWSGASYAQTLSFTGRPNNGVITSSQYMEKDKYYLIGNPYPSAIHADAFLYDNVHNRGILGGTVYFWTHNTAIKLVGPKYAYVSDDYASYNLTGGVASAPSDPNHNVSGADNGLKPTGYIGAGQSFFASAESGSGNVEFTNEMRYGGTHNSQFFKPGKTSRSASMEKHRLWLNLTNAGGAFKQTLIGYIEGATNTYDKIFDGLTYDGNSYIDFYSINEASDLTIQGRALPFTDADVVPLGYRSTIAGEFTIAIDQADGSLATQRVYLEDKQLGTINELTAKNYTFTTKAGTFKNRFVLRYKNNTLGTGDFETTEDAVSVLVQNKTVTVNSTAENIEKVFLYDLSGKLLYTRDNVNNLQLIMQNLGFAQQVLLVKVVLDNGYQTTKKVIFK